MSPVGAGQWLWCGELRDDPGVTEVVELPGAKLYFPHERAADLVPHLRRH
jgi:hypothetical protein